MDRLTLKAAALLIWALAWAGCNGGGAREVGPVRLDLTGVEPTADVSDLAAVLDEAVDARGRIVPLRLAKVRGRLDAQLRRMALAGPTSRPELFPTYGDRWAYWHNARAGWAVKLADLAGFPRRVAPSAGDAGKLYHLEDCHAAGGIMTILGELVRGKSGLLHEDCITVTGRTIGQNIHENDIRVKGEKVRLDGLSTGERSELSRYTAHAGKQGAPVMATLDDKTFDPDDCIRTVAKAGRLGFDPSIVDPRA